MNASPPADTTTTSPRFGRHGPRSKNGCSTCRIRKVKCDERRPLCARCGQAQVKCEWIQAARPRRRTIGVARGAERENVADEWAPAVAEEVRDDSQSLVATDSSAERRLGLVHVGKAPILRAALSTGHIALSNSAQLGSQDWECFQYIPNSYLVLGLGKPWRWSMLAYIHSSIAMHEPGVMRAFTAVAAMELRSRDLSPDNRHEVASLSSLHRARTLQAVAMNNYQLALQDLSSLLARATKPDRTDHDLDALFALWFLMITYGQYGTDLGASIHIHMSGIRHFLSRALQRAKVAEVLQLPPASQQLLHFMCLLDVNMVLGNRQGGQLFLDLTAAPRSSGIHRDQLFEGSRTCLPKIWGSSYPEEQLLDDFENYRGLSMLSTTMKLKLSVWRVGLAVKNSAAVVDSGCVDRLWTKIESVAQEYYDVLALAQMVRSSSDRRVIHTVYHAALEYYAVRILFSCIRIPSSVSDDDGTSTANPRRPAWLDTTLSSLLAIAYKSLAENEGLIYRYAWPLCVALLRTTDPIHREWIRAQVSQASVLLKNMGVFGKIVEELELGGHAHEDLSGLFIESISLEARLEEGWDML